MNHAGTLWAGYGVTIIAVVGYVLWLLRRSRVLGASLDIASTAETIDSPSTDQASTNAATASTSSTSSNG